MDADMQSPSLSPDPAALPPELNQLRQLLKADIEAAMDRVMDDTAKQFETQGEQLDRIEHAITDLQATTNRMDNKLTATVEQVEGLTGRVQQLEGAGA